MIFTRLAQRIRELREQGVDAKFCVGVAITEDIRQAILSVREWIPPSTRPATCAQIHRLDAGYGLGSDRGSPNDGRTLVSKRVMAQIRSPVRVRT